MSNNIGTRGPFGWLARGLKRHLARLGSGGDRFLSTREYGVSSTQDGDTSLDVPCPAVSYSPSQSERICVVAHVYYSELMYELMYFMSHIPARFDVFISTCSSGAKRDIEHAFLGWKRGQVNIAVAPNRGRDISHKLITFRDVYADYTFALMIHSKKSPHGDYLEPWRRYLLSNLAGSEDVASTNLGLLQADPLLGMIAAQSFEPIRPTMNWGESFAPASQLARRMGIDLDERGFMDFPAGSMFWARTSALKPLLDLHLKFEDFEEEGGQTSHTLAHAIERLFFCSCERAGYGWMKVARPELLSGSHISRDMSLEAGPTLREYLQAERLKRVSVPAAPT